MPLRVVWAAGLLWLALAFGSAAEPAPEPEGAPAGGPPASAATAPISDPEAFVSGVYARLASDADAAPPSDIYTPRLQALWADMAKDAGDEVGRIDFEFWTDAQDWKITGVKVTSQPVEQNAGRRIVRALFDNGDRHEDIRFYFERQGDRWLLDDARSVDKDGGWTLSLLLKYGWDGQ